MKGRGIGMCKVSVLVPAYNVEPYIRECLASVRNQTLADLEVLCVDDGSTDGTLAILREYEAMDERIHVLRHAENRGQSCGRNLALSHAVGEYVYMLDADDMILPRALEELYGKCLAGRLDVAGFEARYFTEDRAFWKEAQKKPITYEPCPVMDGRSALVYCMEKEAFSLSVPTFLMRRSYLEELGLRFVEGILHEDVGYIFELISRAERICFFHEAYFVRRIRAQSTMTKGFADANIEGYLKSFLRSFELEKVLGAYYRENPPFEAAVKKWRRDVFGRLRQLYAQSEGKIFGQRGGHVGEEVRRMFEVVKLVTVGEAQAEGIMGEELCRKLKSLPEGQEGEAPQVYICGMGQYAERVIEMAGALGIVVRGILVGKKDRRAFRGFPVYQVGEAQEKELPVIMGVSHYGQEEYEKALREAGYRNVIYVRF